MTGNDLMSPHMTGSDPVVTSFGWKTPGSGCRRPITQVVGTFELLQGCKSQEVSVVTKNDLTALM